jgi:hypothetical protein
MILVTLAAIAIPACGGGGGGGGSGVGEGSSGPTVLLSDTWSSGVSPDWIIAAPAVSVDYTVGNTAPSMLVNANGSANPAVVQTVDTFNTSGGLTLSIDILVNSGSIGQVLIGDAGTTFASVGPTSTIYYIAGQTATVGHSPDGFWHTCRFVVSSGTATWLRDGVAQFSAPFSAPWIYVDLRDYYTGTHFDNALITSP